MINWLFPDIFVKETRHAFKEAFFLSKGKVDVEFLGHVKGFLDMIMIRRQKSSVMDCEIPPKTEVILYLPLTSIQRQLYLRAITGSDHVVGNTSLLTPPPSPGNRKTSCPEPSASKHRAIGNMFMELQKVSQINAVLDISICKN